MAYSFERCRICSKWGWVDSHTCPPSWVVAPEDDPSDMRTFYADDAEEAAKLAAEEMDCGGDYTIVGGSDEVFLVGKAGDLSPARIRVSGETQPVYYAETLGEADD